MEELANAEPIEYDDDPDVDSRYPFGTEAFFHCEHGYKLKGPDYNSCYGNPSSTDGVFGPYPPTCECEFILIVFGSLLRHTELISVLLSTYVGIVSMFRHKSLSSSIFVLKNNSCMHCH